MKQGRKGSGRRKASGGRGNLETLRSRVRQTRQESLPPYRMRRRARNPMEDGRRSSRLGATRADGQALSRACASTGTMRGRPSTSSPAPARQGRRGRRTPAMARGRALAETAARLSRQGLGSSDAGRVGAVPHSEGALRAPRRRRRGRGSNLVAARATDETHASWRLPGSPGRAPVDAVTRACPEGSWRSRERSPVALSRLRNPPIHIGARGRCRLDG